MKLSIVSMEGVLFEGEVNSVISPGSNGEIAIFKNHISLLTSLKPGEVRYEHSGEKQSAYVSGGIMEVKDNLVTIFSDTAMRTKDLDINLINRAKADAEKSLGLDKSNPVSMKIIKESLAQLRLIEQARHN